MNIAARIVSLAAPGEVLLTEVARQAAGVVVDVDFTDRGTQDLRNVRMPVRLLGARRTGTHHHP